MCQDSRPAGYGEIDLAQGADTESVRVGRADQAGRGGRGRGAGGWCAGWPYTGLARRGCCCCCCCYGDHGVRHV